MRIDDLSGRYVEPRCKRDTRLQAAKSAGTGRCEVLVVLDLVIVLSGRSGPVSIARDPHGSLAEFAETLRHSGTRLSTYRLRYER